MAKYAIVKNGTVVNVVEWDGDTESWSPPAGTTAVETTTAGPGWSYSGGVFSPPVEQSPTPSPKICLQARLNVGDGDVQTVDGAVGVSLAMYWDVGEYLVVPDSPISSGASIIVGGGNGFGDPRYYDADPASDGTEVWLRCSDLSGVAADPVFMSVVVMGAS